MRRLKAALILSILIFSAFAYAVDREDILDLVQIVFEYKEINRDF